MSENGQEAMIIDFILSLLKLNPQSHDWHSKLIKLRSEHCPPKNDTTKVEDAKFDKHNDQQRRKVNLRLKTETMIRR